MKNIDMEYFTEYKTVERICRDMYGELGVRAYIEEMEKYNTIGNMHVYNWNNKLKTLKHLKWLRNQIAHDNGSYEVTERDLADIMAFHNELLTQQDPLAVLHKGIEKAKKKQHIPQQKQISSNYEKDDGNDKKVIAILAAASAIVVIIAIAFLLLH